jgi:diguanylate cyclase (GGDEF)-like protein
MRRFRNPSSRAKPKSVIRLVGGTLLLGMFVGFIAQALLSSQAQTGDHLARDVALVVLGLLAGFGAAACLAWKNRNRALTSADERLEATVAERTATLATSVEELHAEIEQRKKTEERIRFLAYYDVLTGLPNRQFLRERLERAIEDSAEEGSEFALLFLDLDRLKEINDHFGHGGGDILLKSVADRLSGCVRRSDCISSADPNDDREASLTVSRQGGDEFTILLTRTRENADATRVATRILESLREPIEIGDREVTVGVSIGIAVYPADGPDADALMKNANTAMTHAQTTGQSDFQYFSEAMKEESLLRIQMEDELRHAIERDEFTLHYQPKLDDLCEKILGIEALLRWNHPRRGLLEPDAFVGVAEESGLIVPIGEWVLREACRQCKQWLDAGDVDLRVAVNVSSLQFRKGSLLSTITDILEEAQLDPAHLEIEVTESTMMQNEEQAARALASLRDIGVRVALDDFGTGYSSLSYVRRLPLDSLKIDRSFIDDLETSEESASIVAAIIAMAHSLDLRVVAEGVATAAQADFLRTRGCDELQGYLFSGPVPPDEIPRLCRDTDWSGVLPIRRSERRAGTTPGLPRDHKR